MDIAGGRCFRQTHIRRNKASMKRKPARLKTLIFLCFAWLLSTPACRSTPVAPPSAPESPLTVPDASPTMIEPPVGTALRLSAKPSPQPIPRLYPESIIGSPEQELAPRRLEYNTILSSRPGESPLAPSWQYRKTHPGQIVGFEFSNTGGNPILPPRRDAAKNQFFTRD